MTIRERPKAVVTGGASGIGRSFCVALGKRRGSVLVADIDEAGARETASLVEAAGGKAAVVRCDTSKQADVQALPGEAESRFGGVDSVVNNAGVAVGGPFESIPIEDWEWLLRINLWGVIYGCYAFLPKFRAQGYGHVINVASVAGLLSAPRMAPYNVSKAGVVALSETLAVELKGDGVGMTVLCPSFTKTNIGKNSRTHDTRSRAVVDKLLERSKSPPTTWPSGPSPAPTGTSSTSLRTPKARGCGGPSA